ncbi:hypothetical protein [Corallococcus carmarthensis]|uniref:hypothetical protein n=1 Tax=Corallococcus carmarthensis TaxID=2316728 RepID=UPI0011C377FF|nr:hypothetical protein [Corallococcus carmarthensis]
MKSSSALLVPLAAFLILAGCGGTQDEAFNTLEDQLNALIAHEEGSSSGEAWSQRITQDALTISLSSDSDPQSVERKFELTIKDNKSIPIEEELGHTEILPSSDLSLLVLHSSASNGIYIFSLGTDQNRKAIELLKNDPILKTAIKADVLCDGIALSSGSWRRDALHPKDEVSAFYAQPDSGGGGGGGTAPSCTSGGAGSSSCSISEAYNMGCSVTCNAGYYACCMSSNTTCKCFKG